MKVEIERPTHSFIIVTKWLQGIRDLTCSIREIDPERDEIGRSRFEISAPGIEILTVLDADSTEVLTGWRQIDTIWFRSNLQPFPESDGVGALADRLIGCKVRFRRRWWFNSYADFSELS